MLIKRLAYQIRGLFRRDGAALNVQSGKRLSDGFRPLHDDIRVAAPVSSW